MDTRILKTKARLIKALSELTQTRSPGEITVSELCKKANVNRTTFYKYYNVPEDVGRESFDRHIEELLDEIHKEGGVSLYEMMVFCCSKYRDNYLITKQVFPGFTVSEEALMRFYGRLNDASVLGGPYVQEFITAGMAAAVKYWLENEPDTAPETIAKTLTDLLGSLLHTKTQETPTDGKPC